MHEVSEVMQLAAPIASVGGLAAAVQLLRAREARRVQVLKNLKSPEEASQVSPRASQQ